VDEANKGARQGTCPTVRREEGSEDKDGEDCPTHRHREESREHQGCQRCTSLGDCQAGSEDEADSGALK
jgi:hypothetical protein